MPQSLARRYFYKLAANFVSIPVYLLMEAILPRALGPALYGNYNFATTLFQQFTGFLDMGTSTCFYNLLSRFQKRISLISFYMRIAIAVFLLVALMAFLLLNPVAGSMFMPDIPLYFAPLAALWAYFIWLGRIARSINDALGLTVESEMWRGILSIGAAISLLLLFFANWLNIATLFIQQYVYLILCCLAWGYVTVKYLAKLNLQFKWQLKQSVEKTYKVRFFNYSHPLFIQALLSFIMLSSERWLLQWFDGSVQQGFYALSQKVGMACFLFVSAMTPLLMRELSIAWGKRNIAGMGEILTRFAPLLFTLAAYFSCFILVEGAVIVKWFGGAEFVSAILPVQIMALYPVHQAYGQIASSVFHAAGKTKILRNMTAAECVYGLIIAWFLIAPGSYGGLNLGAAGLAVKTVFVQFLSVNIYLWLASRFIHFSFIKNLRHQIVVICLFLALAFTSKEIGLLISMDNEFLRFFVNGFFYSFFCLAFCCLFPALIGFDKRDLIEIFYRLIHKQN